MNSHRNRENSRLFSHGRLRSVLVALGAFCAFCVLLSPPVFAQSGAVLGVVSDTSGAVLQGASVTLTNTATGVKTATKTNNEGLYVFPYVQPGVYDVSASAAGFQAMKKPGVTVNVTERVQVGFNLKIGDVKQTVTVEGAAPLLNTVNDVGGQIITRRVINDLPLLNRTVFDLSFLAPGVNQPAGSTYGNQTGTAYMNANEFVSNGSREATANVLIDGVSAGGVNMGGLTTRIAYAPSVDAVQEFKVQQTNFGAEYGNSGSTIVNVITRSGTNALHGSAYDFLRNNKLDSQDYFINQYPAPLNVLPHLERNVFGGTVGGPVLIPHVYNGKNRTFFFFDYEGTRQSSLASSYAGVPSAAEKTGDFGELCNDISQLDGKGAGTFNSSGVCSDPNGQLWDPYIASLDNNGKAARTTPIPRNNIAAYTSPGAGYALPGGTGPGNMIDPAAKKLMSYFPAPNFNAGGLGGIYSPYYNWAASGATGLANHQWDLKIDQNFGDRDRLNGKYAQRLTHQINLNCFNNIADPCSGGVGPQSARLLALDWVHTFGPATVLNISYGYTSVARQLTPAAADPVTSLGMPSYTDQSGFKVLPSILWQYSDEQGAEAGNNDTAIGGQPWSILEDNTASHDILVSLTHIQGRHELKFGGEFLINLYNFSQPGTQNGLMTYGPGGTSQNSGSASGGDNLASFLIGSGFNGWGQYEIPAWLYTQNHGIAGYAQDAFRASKKLTVNVGLRYDLTKPETESKNELSWLDPNAAYPSTVPGYSILHGGLMFASPGERSALNADYKDFSPRVGLAYTLNDKTVIRTGYGIYYGMSRAAANAAAITPNDPGFDGTTSWPTSYNWANVTPWAGLSNPFPYGITPVTGSSLGFATQIGNSSSAPNGFERTMNATPYTESWNFGIQRQLPASMLLNVEYIGQESTHQYFGIGGNYNIDHLGAQEEKMSTAQLQALNNQVPNPFSGIIPNSTGTTSQYQLDLPYPQFSGLDITSPPWANANYQALQLGLEKRFSNGLSFLVTYVWSKSLDDDSNPGNAGGSGLGFAPAPADPNNLKLARSVSQYNIPQVFQFSYDYHLPVGRGQHFGAKMNRVLDAVVGGWQTTGIWRFDDGQPMTWSMPSGTAVTLPGYGQAPNLVGTPHANPKSKWFLPASQGGGYFANPGVFQMPASYAIGNAPRTIPWMHYPGTSNANLSLFKEFSMNKLREGMHLELRTEWFNAFNHPQFNNVNISVSPSNTAFGQITGPDANSAREIQMAMKLYF
ncbi:MAG: carboxypeptidase regulatory-like domain-containing protein [Acidobacteriota bacterium]|nr:carboxypeptidase regulatory-like domain-containing protein [Acidobacteriota bacterium]